MKFNFNKSEERELGFGTSVNASHQRIMNRDGSANVLRKGISRFNFINIYHYLIGVSWGRFFLFVFIGYIILNSVFACIYVAIGVENLTGVISGTFAHNFWEAFFFSSQSFTTVGYGRVAPISKTASALAAFESLMGLMMLALATGLMYGRFSRPRAAIMYSTRCLIAPYKEITALMFRIANARVNQLIEIETSVTLAYNSEVNGKVQRKFQNLELELKKINFLALSWTIVHPIDDNSPFKNLTEDDIKNADVEILIQIKAVDDTYATTVYSRSSYKWNEFVWRAKFSPIIGIGSDGRTSIDLGRLSEYDMVKTE